MNEVTDFDPIRDNEVILPVISSVNIIDDCPHAGSASTGCSLRVAISQIDQDIVEDMVSFLHEAILERLHAIPDPLPQGLILEEPLNNLPEDGVQVGHDVPGREQLGLFLFKCPLAEGPETGGNNVLHRLGQELLHASFDVLA